VNLPRLTVGQKGKQDLIRLVLCTPAENVDQISVLSEYRARLGWPQPGASGASERSVTVRHEALPWSVAAISRKWNPAGPKGLNYR